MRNVLLIALAASASLAAMPAISATRVISGAGGSWQDANISLVGLKSATLSFSQNFSIYGQASNDSDGPATYNGYVNWAGGFGFYLQSADGQFTGFGGNYWGTAYPSGPVGARQNTLFNSSGYSASGLLTLSDTSLWSSDYDLSTMFSLLFDSDTQGVWTALDVNDAEGNSVGGGTVDAIGDKANYTLTLEYVDPAGSSVSNPLMPTMQNGGRTCSLTFP